MLDAALQRIWYGRSPLAILFFPLTGLFALATGLRRACSRIGVLQVTRVSKPVIIVGNLTVGGTGKTPLVIWLTRALRERGFTPGIITRGYGGSSSSRPRDVDPNSDPNEVGDEAVLLAQRTKAIVVSGRDRVRSAERAIQRGADVIVSDDGLQHYRLARNIEIAVVDDDRRLGNGFLLPAGPLRESAQRLGKVDLVVRNLRDSGPSQEWLDHPRQFIFRSSITTAKSLVTGQSRGLQTFAGERVHAIAAIGHPRAFFDALRSLGLQVDARGLADHAPIGAVELQFNDTAPILMTEKDAVKCRTVANERCWFVPLESDVIDGDRLLNFVLSRLDTAR
jgi:tetraacyldisaccharide 4'-kinase